MDLKRLVEDLRGSLLALIKRVDKTEERLGAQDRMYVELRRIEHRLTQVHASLKELLDGEDLRT